MRTMCKLIVLLLCFIGGYMAGCDSQPPMRKQSEPVAITTLNGGTIQSTIAYPEQGRYYVKVKGDDRKTETWEVSKGYFDRVILGAPINRRDNTND